MNEYSTTPEDFDRFKAEVGRMLDVLGLMDWSVVVTHAHIDRPVSAEFAFNHAGRIARITLNTTTMREGFDPVRSARHEVFELLLTPIVHLAESRTVLPEDIEAATHGIIRRLEHVDRMTREPQPSLPPALHRGLPLLKDVDRTHEECECCRHQADEPPTCSGHRQGPVGCELFQQRRIT